MHRSTALLSPALKKLAPNSQSIKPGAIAGSVFSTQNPRAVITQTKAYKNPVAKPTFTPRRGG